MQKIVQLDDQLLDEQERGFTLIEVMVVVAIILRNLQIFV